MTLKCIKSAQRALCVVTIAALITGCDSDLPAENSADNIEAPKEALYAPAQIVNVSITGLAVSIDGLAPEDSQVVVVSALDGKAVSKAKAGEDKAQDVNWQAEVMLPPLSGQIAVDRFGFKTILPDEVEAFSPERITILRKRPDNDIGPHQQAVILSRPGAASIIMDDPLEPLKTAQGLRLYSIDYDDNGSVIFSGRSERRGRIRIYVDGEAIGETGLGEGGNWFVIAGWTLPVGTYPIEIHRIGADPRMPAFQTSIYGAAFRYTTFNGMPPLTLDRMAIAFTRGDQKNGALKSSTDFTATPSMWEYCYDIPGGGRQYTAIYGAKSQGVEPQTEPRKDDIEAAEKEPPK